MASTQPVPQHPVIFQAPVSEVTVSRMGQALGVKTTKCIAVTLMLLGIAMALLQTICTIIVEKVPIHWTAHVAGTGVWCGIIIFISGVVGMQLASKKTNALAIAFLVFNVLCVLIFAPIVIGTTGGDLGGPSKRFCVYVHRYNRHDDDRDNYDCSYLPKLKALTVLMLIDAIAVFCISIWAIVTNSTAIEKAKACGCCCRCCEDPAANPQSPIVVYMPANQMPAGAQNVQYAFPNPGAYQMTYVPQNQVPFPVGIPQNQAPYPVGISQNQTPVAAAPVGAAAFAYSDASTAVPPPYKA